LYLTQLVRENHFKSSNFGMKRRRVINPFSSDVPFAKRRKIEILEIHESDIFTAYSWGRGLCALFPSGVKKEAKPRLIETLDNKFDIRTYRMLKSGVGVIFDVHGRIYSFGDGFSGALGLGSEVDMPKPKQIETLEKCDIVQICGQQGIDGPHTHFLTSRGDVFGCGSNIRWIAIGREQVGGSDTVLVPLGVDLSDDLVVEISCSLYCSGAVSASRTRISCWGYQLYGILGRLNAARDGSGPGDVEGPIQQEFRIDAFCFGGYHGMALTLSAKASDEQKLWIWGKNQDSQYGNGSTDGNSHPIATVLTFFAEKNLRIEKISCGELSCSCITTEGILFMWGSFGSYQMISHIPMRIKFANELQWCRSNI